MKTENMHLSTNSRDKENVSSQDDSIINVKIVCVLTPLTCATLVNEIFKSLLYQKTQIPYPYSWLRAVVHKKRSKSDNEETNKQINFTVANHFRVVSNAYDTLEKIMKAIIKEFSENANYIKEIIFLFGTTPQCPKEIFTINLMSIAEGHSERNHANHMDKCQQKILRFYNQHGFPGVIGCIDCTHVAIYPPYIEHPDYPEYLYVNRKSYHSINVQLICDANLKILNICARYPGSTHDSFIWNNSNVQTLMRNLHQRTHTDYYLLGNSGYPLRSWLLTPLEEEPAQNTPEHTYNSIHKTTRVKIECCNGLLKGRFRCLIKHRVLHYNPAFSCKIINACAVLHNMCIEYNIPAPDLEDEGVEIDFGMLGENEVIFAENEEDNVFRRVNPELANGRRARSKVIQIFARRRHYNI